MQERGFGLTRTASINGFGLQVENVEKWMAYMVLEFEKTSGTRVSANSLFGLFLVGWVHATLFLMS